MGRIRKRKSLVDIADYDYDEKLDPEALKWLQKFHNAYYDANYRDGKKIGFTKKELNQISKDKKEREKNIMRVCNAIKDPLVKQLLDIGDLDIEALADPFYIEDKEQSATTNIHCHQCDHEVEKLKIYKFGNVLLLTLNCHGKRALYKIPYNKKESVKEILEKFPKEAFKPFKNNKAFN